MNRSCLLNLLLLLLRCTGLVSYPLLKYVFSYFSSVHIMSFILSLNDQIVTVLVFDNFAVVAALQVNLSAIVQCLRKYFNLFQSQLDDSTVNKKNCAWKRVWRGKRRTRRIWNHQEIFNGNDDANNNASRWKKIRIHWFAYLFNFSHLIRVNSTYQVGLKGKKLSRNINI